MFYVIYLGKYGAFMVINIFSHEINKLTAFLRFYKSRHYVFMRAHKKLLNLIFLIQFRRNSAEKTYQIQ